MGFCFQEQIHLEAIKFAKGKDCIPLVLENSKKEEQPQVCEERKNFCEKYKIVALFSSLRWIWNIS